MKTCDCGGMWHRNGERNGAQSYRCAECGKTITVRNGQIVTKRGPRVRDWRTEQPQEHQA